MSGVSSASNRVRTWAGGPAILTVAAVGVVACLVAVAVGGGAVPSAVGLADPGATARWGTPIASLVRDLASAITIGLLVVGVAMVPDEKSGRSARMIRLVRAAVPIGFVWVLASLVHVVLSFAVTSGTAPGSSLFWQQFGAFAWSLETQRVELISLAVAVIATGLAGVVTSRHGAAWAAGFAVAALLPLALGGHAAGAGDHETAVNTIAMHYLGIGLWVGGLAAIVLCRSLIEPVLPVVLSRYSALAGVCFVMVGVSGAAAGWIRVDGFSSLISAYGALLGAKTVALIVLGGFGWFHRRRIVGQLAQLPTGESSTARRLFTRLAVVEVAVMAVAAGVGAALAVSPSPTSARPRPDSVVLAITGYPMPDAPTAASWITTWRFDWLFGVVSIVAVAVYLAWVVRLVRRGDRWPVLRTIWWVIGWAVFAWSTNGAPAVYGRVSFSWHMTQHMVISMAVPILLVMAAPVTLALRAMHGRRDGSMGPREILLAITHSRYLNFVVNPVVAAAVFFVSLIAFYYSSAFPLALTTHTGHVLMTVHFLMSGYLFAWSLVGIDPGPRKWPPSLRLIVLTVTISMHAFFGVALMMSTDILAPDVFGRLQVPWVPDLVADQQLGGSITWGVGDLPSLWLAMIVAMQWARSDRREQLRVDRQADRDGDAVLNAYNERLARLKRSDQRSDQR